MSLDIRQDFLLNKTLKLKQFATGYRVAIDPVFLAAFVEKPSQKTAQKILDVGCGVGAVSLCLAHRFPKIVVEGIDLQSELVELAKQNVEDNGFQGRLDFQTADLFAFSKTTPHQYNIVISNPPFYEAKASNASPHKTKALAHHSDYPLQNWFEACFRLLKSKGVLYTISPFADFPEVISSLPKPFSTHIFPLWPKAQTPAKRILLKIVKDSKAPSKLFSGLVLHEEDGSYTKRAHSILQQGESLIYP